MKKNTKPVALKPGTPQEKSKFPMEKLMTGLYLLILLVGFIKIYDHVFDRKLHLGGDNVGYYLLGKSIAEGKGYTNIHLPEEPPANHFPPGYPLITAGVMKVFGTDFITIKKANGFMLFAAIVLLFFLFKEFSNNIHLAFATCFLLIFNLHILKFSFDMYSEIPFLLFSCATLFFFTRLKFELSPYKSRNFFLFIIALGFSYHIRTLGIALFAGCLLSLLLQKNFKYFIATFVGFLITILPWTIRGIRLGENSYLSQLIMKNPYRPEEGLMAFPDWFSRFYINLKRYVSREIPSSVKGLNIDEAYNNPVALQEYLMGGFIILLIIAGIFFLKRHKLTMAGYLAGTMFILLLWPEVWVGNRFFIPIIPFVVFLAGITIYSVFDYALKRFTPIPLSFRSSVLPLGLLFFIPVHLPGVKHLYATRKGQLPDTYSDYFKVAEWAKSNTPADAVIASRKPEFFYLYSERKSTYYMNSNNPKELFEDLEKRNITYVVLDQLGYSSTGRYLVPALRNNQFKIQSVFSMAAVNKSDYYPTNLFKIFPECKYEGDVKDGIFKDGLGKANFPDGSVYSGNWKMDTISGFGKMVYDNGSFYEGNWENGTRKGHGKFVWQEGLFFEGEWDNARSGKGIYHNGMNGTKIKGVWKNDILVGEAEVLNAQGRLIERHLYNEQGKFVRVIN
jgi:hypothetical protein